MLKFTKKGIYGITILLDLACSRAEIPRSIKQIAENTQISVKYMEQIFISLKKTGYIKSFRGPGGGYILVKPPAEINIGKVLRILEESLEPVKCISGDVNNECTRSNVCITQLLWQKLFDEISSVINQTTLEDLQQKFQVWSKNRKSMYYI